MADDDKIIIPIEVTGVDKIAEDFKTGKTSVDEFGAALDKLSTRQQAEVLRKTGLSPEDAVNTVRGARELYNAQGPEGSSSSKPPKEPSDKQHYINVEQQVFGETGEAASESTAAIRLFREALHALHPALSEAGIGAGELGALVSAARGGIVALVAAIGTLLVTALEKAGDAANDAATKLGGVSGGIAAGRLQYGALTETADKLQTPASGLVTPFEQAARLNQSQATQAQLPNAGLLEAIANIVKGGQSERLDTAKVLDEFTKFLSNGREKGVFGPEDFKALENIAPRTAAAIIEQLPKGQSSFTGAQVLGAARAAGVQIDVNAIEEQAKQPESIARAWEKVKAAYEKAEAAAPHGDVIAQALDGIAAFFNKVGEARERARKAADDVQKLIDNPPEARGPRQSGEFLGSAIDHPDLLGRKNPFDEGGRSQFAPAKTQDSYTAFDAENSGRLASEAEKASDALAKLTGATESTQKKFDEFHADGKKAISDKSTDIGFQQAEIERRYEPAETRSKLEKDQISVQNADIHLEQAKISGLEAQKNLSLSRLAPEEARERVQSAESTRDSALSKFFRNRGVDTTQLDAINAQGADQRELEPPRRL
jgi:hypothetical protein